jgi:hypothetical protein
MVEPERLNEQRERMAQRFANRARTPATADFDLPAPSDEVPGAHHLTLENVAAVIKDLREIEDGTTERPVIDRDWRTWAGVLARIMEWLAASTQPASDAQERPTALSYADATQWARENGLNVPPEWEGKAERAPSGEPTDDELLTLAAEQDYAEEDPKCVLRLMRAAIALARRATAGTTAAPSGDWYDAEDGVEHSHPKYGRGVFFTYNCAKPGEKA